LKIKHNPFAKAFLDAKERPDGFYPRDFMPNYPQAQQPQYTQCEYLLVHGNYKMCFTLRIDICKKSFSCSALHNFTLFKIGL